MPRMPGADWRPVPNCTRGGQEAVYGVVLHIMEGTLSGTDAWFRNSSSQASAHFGVGRDGRIYQWVDTADRAWAQAAGNRTWLSIEHEGHTGDSLTPAQLAATARIVAWAHRTHGVPLQSTDSVTGRGVGWHGMGGNAWGGHYDCPGNPIKAQRAAIIAAAGGSTEDDMTPEQDRMLRELHAVLFPSAGWGFTNDAEAKAAATRHERAPQAWDKLSRIDAGVRTLLAELAATRAAMATLAAHPNATPDQIKAASKAGAAEALAEGVVHVQVTGLDTEPATDPTTQTGA